VWLTADMPLTAAHHYDPSRAVFREFEPSGNSSPVRCMPAPGRAGELDNTFGPKSDVPEGLQRRAGRKPRPPVSAAVLGRIDIDGKTEVMTVT